MTASLLGLQKLVATWGWDAGNCVFDLNPQRESSLNADIMTLTMCARRHDWRGYREDRRRHRLARLGGAHETKLLQGAIGSTWGFSLREDMT